jgi:hypothetical protein
MSGITVCKSAAAAARICLFCALEPDDKQHAITTATRILAK